MPVSTAFVTLLAASTLSITFAKPFIGAWFPDWTGTDLSTVRWSDYTELEFFVAVTTPDLRQLSYTGMDDEGAYMKEFTKEAKAHGVKPTLSIGGWTGSQYFSSAVGSAVNRTIFAITLATALQTYGFEGVNLDWEYPGASGIGCNIWSGDDAANFLAFTKVLRAKLGPSKSISAAVAMTGFVDEAGDPLTDSSEYAKYVDNFVIMAYDVAGNWNELTGVNAPLSAACAPEQQAYSVSTAFDYWTSTGFPADKLILGIPTYAYIFNLTDDKLVSTKYGSIPSYAYQNKTADAVQAGPDDAKGTDICGAATDFSSSYEYTGLVDAAIITADGKGKNGWTRYWDKCTATPFLYNKAAHQFITYDDPTSVAIKPYWAREHGMLGVKFFEYTGDNGLLAGAAKKQLQSKAGTPLGINIDVDISLFA